MCFCYIYNHGQIVCFCKNFYLLLSKNYKILWTDNIHVFYQVISNSLFILLAVFIRKDVMGKAQLVLLDHGLYDKLTPDDRQSLCNLYKSIVLNKEDKMKEFSKALGVDGILM